MGLLDLSRGGERLPTHGCGLVGRQGAGDGRQGYRAVRRHPQVATGALIVVLVVGLPLGWYLG